MQIAPRAHSCGGKCKSSRRWALRLHPRRHRPHRSLDPRQTFCQSGGHAKQRRRATTTNFLSGPACKRAHAIYLPRRSCNIVKPPTKRRLSLSRTISPIITRRARSRDLFLPANGRVTSRTEANQAAKQQTALDLIRLFRRVSSQQLLQQLHCALHVRSLQPVAATRRRSKSHELRGRPEPIFVPVSIRASDKQHNPTQNIQHPIDEKEEL